VLAPIRRIIPPLRVGGMALDLAPLVLFFGIAILRSMAS
jgi:YggT family protein